MTTDLDAPFPWFGGKRRVAAEVWRRFGAVTNYVEPFFGAGAVLLGRPAVRGVETVNDIDGMVSNFWRSVRYSPDATAAHADWPVNENDLHARHAWLLARKASLRERLEGDPEWHDPQIAGWWVWGQCAWIGHGWCSGAGPWHVVDGRLVRTGDDGGQTRPLPHIGTTGHGVHRKLPLPDWFAALSERLRRVRVCCGDWSRVTGPSVTSKHGLTGVFLDPPYADTAARDSCVYSHDSLSVAHDVREWALAHGDDPRMRIALCGYEGEHVMPASWSRYAWKANGGFGSHSDGAGRANSHRERLWFSPHCLAGEAAQTRLL